MAEREVTVKLNVAGAIEASKAMAAVADQTGRAGKAATAAKREFDATSEAMRRIGKAQQEAQVQAAMGRFQAAGVGGAGAKAGGGFLPALGGAAAIGGLGAGFQKAATQLNELDLASGHFGRSIGMVVENFAQGIPIVGQFITGIGDWIRATRDSAQELKAQADFVSGQVRRSAGFQQSLSIRAGGADQIASARAQAELLGIGAGTLGGAGVMNSRRAAELAAATSAGQSASSVLDARSALNARERALQERGRQFAGDSNEMKLARGDVLQAQIALNDKLAAQATAIADQQKAAERSREAQVAIAQRQLEVSQKELATAKERVSVLQQERSRVFGAAAQFGLASSAEQQGVLASFKQLQQRGVGSLRPEQISALQGNQLTGQALQDAAAQQANKNPLFKELLALTGNRELAAIERDLKVQQQITVKLELDNERTKAAVAEIMEEYVRKFEIIVKTATENQLARVAVQQGIARGQQ